MEIQRGLGVRDGDLDIDVVRIWRAGACTGLAKRGVTLARGFEEDFPWSSSQFDQACYRVRSEYPK